MRQLIVTTFLTLDGVMEAPGGGDHPHAGWSFKDVEFDEAAYEMKGTEQAEAGAILMGRVSYHEFAPVWPTMAEFESYNAGEKYVVSTTLDGDTAPWGDRDPVRVLRSTDDLRVLNEGAGGPTLAHGSAPTAEPAVAATPCGCPAPPAACVCPRRATAAPSWLTAARRSPGRWPRPTSS